MWLPYRSALIGDFWFDARQHATSDDCEWDNQQKKPRDRRGLRALLLVELWCPQDLLDRAIMTTTQIIGMKNSNMIKLPEVMKRNTGLCKQSVGCLAEKLAKEVRIGGLSGYVN